MDFSTASKIFWTVSAPGNFLLLMLCVGLALITMHKRRAGLRIVAIATIGFLVVAMFPLGNWLIAPLENRFPHPLWPRQVDGVLVLGGGEDPALFSTRGTAGVITFQGRLVGALELSRHYPQARVVFTGFEAEVARAAFDQLGLDANRITFERHARNTWENLMLSRDLVAPKAGEIWLMVTPAIHMPRSMGVAQRIGWNMTAWPVDYITGSDTGYFAAPSFQFANNLGLFELAVREWIGLIVYRMTGRSAAVFPAPVNHRPAVTS